MCLERKRIELLTLFLMGNSFRTGTVQRFRHVLGSKFLLLKQRQMCSSNLESKVPLVCPSLVDRSIGLERKGCIEMS